MVRSVLAVSLVFLSSLVFAQNHAQFTSDSAAISVAQKALAALTGKIVIADVSINVSVTSALGSENEIGSGTFLAKGSSQSRIDMRLSNGTRTDIRSISNEIPVATWLTDGQPAKPYALHNCWTSAVWFFPALSALSQVSKSNFVFSYVGAEQHGELNTQHLRVVQIDSQDTKNILAVPRLSTADFYLDPMSFLPVAMIFNVHPDEDMNTDIPVEIRFADYRHVSGAQVPFHIQKFMNGSLILDITVTDVALNSGLTDSSFTIQ